MNRHLKVFEELYKDTKNKFPDFKAGDTIEVKTKIKEGEKMQQKTYHKFDICDKTWEKIEPHLMGRRGKMVE